LGGEIYAENISDDPGHEKGADQNSGARFVVLLKAA